ncbi:tetratricopeptide repeat protein [Sphingorhabdus soli]|uniref:Tetratricopeptide repeat protein n=1 Tax=Flavisphingopyxis soli TaxID=2601267 RepID=A0A5C6UKG3_9SPHN|nr:tetratricopeptide repeat protein [Sphingorhabdus soli]TXC73572.1 tetratricopeptide repeat protein [Sphingorhabdus soli]
MATQGLNLEEQKAVDAFRRQVVEPSMTGLVIVDFWAEWCGPCKALTPVLEKVAADYADKGVVLAKINVDEDKFIAAQFQVRSIPTVYAIFQGQPVADLTQARSESQLKAMLDEILAKLPIEAGDSAPTQDVAPLLAMGEEVLTGGDAARAIGIFSQIIELAPDTVAAQAGLARALAADGQVDAADEVLAALDEEAAKDPAVERARAAIALVRDRPDEGALAALNAAFEANRDDMQARFDLAAAQIAAGERDAPSEHLLAMIEADRDWNDGAAKARLLDLFQAIGLEDPWVAATRRRLSAILFG